MQWPNPSCTSPSTHSSYLIYIICIYAHYFVYACSLVHRPKCFIQVIKGVYDGRKRERVTSFFVSAEFLKYTRIMHIVHIGGSTIFSTRITILVRFKNYAGTTCIVCGSKKLPLPSLFHIIMCSWSDVCESFVSPFLRTIPFFCH